MDPRDASASKKYQPELQVRIQFQSLKQYWSQLCLAKFQLSVNWNGMEREQNRLPRGNSLGNAVEEELLKYINEQEFLSPEISKPFIELLTWFQTTTLHVSSEYHQPWPSP